MYVTSILGHFSLQVNLHHTDEKLFFLSLQNGYSIRL